MEPLLENGRMKEEKSIIDDINEYRKSHGILFWVILTVLMLLVIAVVAIVIYFIGRNKNKPKENFSSSDSISNEFDYVNSYIYSTLGEDGSEKVDEDGKVNV